jgi:hypothetical protein
LLVLFLLDKPLPPLFPLDLAICIAKVLERSVCDDCPSCLLQTLWKHLRVLPKEKALWVKNSPTIVALRNRAAESVDPDDDEEDEDDEDDDDEKNNKKKTKIFVDTTSVS